MGGEDQLIKELARSIPSDIAASMDGRSRSRAVRVGIGDDAAVLRLRANCDLLVTCDAFLEGVHFLTDRHPPDSVGYKSLARATSDIAAMGGIPRFFLLTLALPEDRTEEWLGRFLQGMRRAARELGLRLIGGDTTRYPSISITITVLGQAAPGHSITRARARPGDILYVTGRLGSAKLGLELIRNAPLGEIKALARRQRQLLRPHLYPKIHVGLGKWLATHRIASSMIDISDGLSTDLAHLCTASSVGARTWADRIPCVEIPPGQSRLACSLKLDPLQMALHGGDDYQLLFTVPRRLAKRLRSAPDFRDITAIGEIERGRGILLVDSAGRARPLKQGGWDPFR